MLGILASWVFIIIVVYFGDYNTKELEKQKQQWYDLFKEKYK